MSGETFADAESMAATALADEANRLADGFRAPVDEAFRGCPE